MSWFLGRARGTTEVPASKWPEPLASNKGIFNAAEVSLIGKLLYANQEHLFVDWDAPGTRDAEKRDFLNQMTRLNETYPGKGGLFDYLKRARELLDDSKEGVNPFSGWIPEVPLGVHLDPSKNQYYSYEAEGCKDLGTMGFVLVAGGLGERLGYNDVKIGLPVETTTMMSYLEFYVKEILAMQERYAAPGRKIPLAIMVSGDTEERTEALLKANAYFGMDAASVTIMRQEKVAALTDNDAHISKTSTYEVNAKPHGHGDVHALMYSTGTAAKWFRNGVQWVTFFQDTNGLGFKTLPAVLGVSKMLSLEVNSLAVHRVAKQAVGAICKLQHADGRRMTVNVEYNQLDPLLRATVNEGGDVNDPHTGMSPFPGNINQLVFKMAPYMRTLLATSGMMPEFVNPKYADDSKVLDKNCKVGFTSAPAWLCYSPCKNNATDAVEMAKKGVPGGSAVTAEADQYNANAQLLRIIGCTVGKAQESHWLGIPASLGPAIVFDPSFAIFPGEIRQRFPKPEQVSISAGSTLVVSGNVRVESLRLEGACILRCKGRGKLTVRVPAERPLRNKGHRFVGAGVCDGEEAVAMRGYRCETREEIVSEANGLQELIFDGEETVPVLYWIKHLSNKNYSDDCGCRIC